MPPGRRAALAQGSTVKQVIGGAAVALPICAAAARQRAAGVTATVLVYGLGRVTPGSSHA